MDSDLDGT
jgi:WD40 repeat protein